MKKTILFLFSMAALLLPWEGLAQSKPKIKSVDITLPVPAPGVSLFDAREYQLISAKTEYGDLAPTGGIKVQSLDWIGDFRDGRGGDMFFKDGFTYKVRLQFMIDPSGKYDTDYIFKNNDYYIDETRISATVNGVKAKVLRSAPYFINVELSLPVGNGGEDSEYAQAQNKPAVYDLNKSSYRASMKAYSISEADAASPEYNPQDLITITDAYHPLFAAGKRGEFTGQDVMRITRVIVDTDDEKIYSDVAIDVNNSVQGTYNIREVWISDKVDAMKFILGIYSQMRIGHDVDNGIYYPNRSTLFHSQRATLFVPESAAAAILQRISRPTWSRPIIFSLKTYSGDVYSAQKAGAEAAKPICSSHNFTAKLAGADRAVRYATCRNWSEYYYSCRICGECENNPKHTFQQPHLKTEVLADAYYMPLADDQAYIGVNAAGHHVWWYSCIWCGHSYGYDQKNMSRELWKASGTSASYEYFRKAMADAAGQLEEQALLQTETSPNMFILRRKSEAKMSPAFQSSVNFALNDNLIDESLLGDDYTRPLTRRQLSSLAVRLVEELTGKQTSSSAIGLDSALGGTAGSDDAVATRQEAAAVMYRALRFIEESKLYSYTEFDSGLDKYSDSGSIAPWAQEAMAFMEALGLVKGSSKTTIAPSGAFTIEEGIELAEKCTHAHQLGWYQARSWGEGRGRSYDGELASFPVTSGGTRHDIAPGERIWVVGPRLGVTAKFLPVVDSYTGQTVYADAEWFRPVRKKVYNVKGTIVGPVVFQEHF